METTSESMDNSSLRDFSGFQSLQDTSNRPLSSTMTNGQMAMELNSIDLSQSLQNYDVIEPVAECQPNVIETVTDMEADTVIFNHSSFNNEPEQFSESNLEHIVPPPRRVSDAGFDENEETYTLIEGATQNGRPLLVSSKGYELILKHTPNMNKDNGKTWECKRKLKGNKCNFKYMPNRK